MTDLIASISKNSLKLSIITKNGFQTTSRELPPEVVNDSHVVDDARFGEAFLEMLEEFQDVKKNDLRLTFLVEPKDVLLRFVTVDKSNENIDEQVLSNVSDKLEVAIEDLYFSYQKIAPFVYQFVAINKDHMNGLLELSNGLQIPLKGVVPWVALLPKYLETNDPCVFLLKTENTQIVALSELNGIYFCESYDNEKSVEEIEKLVTQLAVYKRSEPIHKIYTNIKDEVSLNDNYEVVSFVKLSDDVENSDGFGTHLLIEYFYEKNPHVLDTQINLLNLLPTPVENVKNKSLVYVGAAVGIVVMLVIGYGLYARSEANSEAGGELAEQPIPETNVLSEQDNTPESTESTDNSSEEDTSGPLLPENLNIRVENGAGVEGIAGVTKEFLEEKGYTVVDIGNADEIGRETTLIIFTEETLKYKDVLVKDLSEKYEVETQEDLESGLEYDVLVIVGSTQL